MNSLLLKEVFYNYRNLMFTIRCMILSPGQATCMNDHAE